MAQNNSHSAIIAETKQKPNENVSLVVLNRKVQINCERCYTRQNIYSNKEINKTSFACALQTLKIVFDSS